jgi:hypothetical protein
MRLSGCKFIVLTIDVDRPEGKVTTSWSPIAML